MRYELTQHAKDVIKAREIKLEWIKLAIESPLYHKVISDNEEHFFKTINEFSKRCLKVVANPKNRKIITAYFDRNMRKRGCKDEN